MSGMLTRFSGYSAFLTEGIHDRIFGLDWQLLNDIGVTALSIFVLFLFLSYLLFNPVRNFLKKRQEFVASEIVHAQQDKEEANQAKLKYNARLKEVNKEAEQILSETRKKALKRETAIVEEAKEEAHRIVIQAGKEAELEKSRVQNEVKQEMIAVAAAMAGKIIEVSLDQAKQDQLVEDALKEMGDRTWQS